MDKETTIKGFAGELRTLSHRIGLFVMQLPSGNDTLERITDELLTSAEDVDEAAEEFEEPEDEDEEDEDESPHCVGEDYDHG